LRLLIASARELTKFAPKKQIMAELTGVRVLPRRLRRAGAASVRVESLERKEHAQDQ
jgi:hypothetical protein